MNYEKKLQNYNFNGPVPKWTNYYKNVFNDFQLNFYFNTLIKLIINVF